MLTACATALLIQMVAAPSAGAQRPEGRTANFNASGISVLTVPLQTIHLEPITVHELVGDTRQPSAEANLSVYYQNGEFVARGNLSPAPLPSVIRRPLRGLWRLAGPMNEMRRQKVRVALESPDGQPGVLSSTDDPRQQLPVAVTETAARTVSFGPQSQGTEGDVVLEIPTAALGSASHYRGRLVIRIEGY